MKPLNAALFTRINKTRSSHVPFVGVVCALLIPGLATAERPPLADTIYINQSSSVAQVNQATGVETSFGSGGMSDAYGLTADSQGNVYTADAFADNTIYKITPAGIQSVFTSAGPNNGTGIAVDAAGNVYVADYSSNNVYEYSPAGTSLGIFGTETGSGMIGLTFDVNGNLYATDQSSNDILEWGPGGGAATVFATGLGHPQQIAYSGGNFFVLDETDSAVQEVDSSGDVSTIITGTSSNGVAVDEYGRLFVGSAATGELSEYVDVAGTWTLQTSFTGVSSSLSLAVVPEPSDGAIILGGAVLVLGLLRLRRRQQAA